MEERDDIRALQNQVDGLGKKVDSIYYALLGNELAKDGGLVTRIIDLEKSDVVILEKIDQLEKRNISGDLYVKWLWALCASIITSVCCAFIYHYFKIH